MSDLPTKEWFTKVDSVTSLVGHRRYGLTDDDLASQLIEISGEARMFAKTVVTPVCEECGAVLWDEEAHDDWHEYVLTLANTVTAIKEGDTDE